MRHADAGDLEFLGTLATLETLTVWQCPKLTRLDGVEQPDERKRMQDIARMRTLDPADVREMLGDGSLGGLYERPDEDVLRVWQAGVEEVRDVLAYGWGSRA